MANALYDSAKAAILTNTLDVENGDIRALLVDSSYVVDTSAHDNLDDIGGGSRVGSAVALSGKTVAAGVFDADDVVFSGLTGDDVAAVVLYLHTGVESTSKLFAYLDTATGIPRTLTGGDMMIRWSNGSNKIFKLV